ncbi:MAG: hypothetical protein NTX53_07640 [candidate division WOR-3 bacterium]|nr:hypothetical protein [candidate division WOR-3 bacterium]
MCARRMVTSGFLHSELGRRLAPRWLKSAIKSAIPYAEFRSEQALRDAEKLLGGPISPQSDYASPYPFSIGIITDTSYYFAHHVRACREMRVAYRLVDLSVDNWVELVRESGCCAFLVSPSTLLSILRHMFDERLRVLAENMNYPLYPSYSELWLWESKRRMRDWLVAHDVPHPRTDVFYDREEALAFVDAADYPLVCKTDTSAAANGVFVLRDRRAARRMAREAFGRGILPRQWDHRDRQRGNILFQAFVPHDHEWRIVRIGDDYLCRRKARVGDFASGSGGIEWAKPTEEMLSFVEEVTDRGSFTSMGVDFFVVSPGGPREMFLVNELQCLVGEIVNEQNRNEHTGKWRRDNGNWTFEPGFFYQNACANLRVAFALGELARNQSSNTTQNGEEVGE